MMNNLLESIRNLERCVEEIERFVNHFSPHKEELFKQLRNNEVVRRNFSEIANSFMYYMKGNSYDDRNEASVEFAKQLAEQKKISVPEPEFQKIGKELCMMHRTLQQNFARVCRDWWISNGEITGVDYCLPMI